MLHQANPTAGMAALVSDALWVGRDHIAATVNTLFLAYAGAALPSLILFVTGRTRSSWWPWRWSGLCTGRSG